MMAPNSGDGWLDSERNLTKYDPSLRPGLIACAREQSREFRRLGGMFRAPKTMSGFASLNAATKVINLSRSEMADAKLAALIEEVIHFQQAKDAGIFGNQRGWLSRYTLIEWQEKRIDLELEVDEIMVSMGFIG